MEDVMVVSNSAITYFSNLFANNNCQLIKDEDKKIYSFIEQNYLFMPREIAEYSIDYKQVIPYVVIENAGYLYTLTRLNKQTEIRLHGKRSIGIGGHINPSEQCDNIILQGLERELMEEVSIHHRGNLKYLGIICDNITEVSRVHIGVAFILTVKDKSVYIIEKEKMSGEWVSIHDLYCNKDDDSMETWSQIILNHEVF